MALFTTAVGWKKRLLVGVCVASACLMFVELVFARRIRASEPSIWQIELLVLPWVLFIGSYLSIVATSWFDSQASGNLIRRALSLVAAAGVLGLVTLIYFALVF